MSKGKYLLSRDVELDDSGGARFGAQEQEELAACIFASDKASPLVFSVDLVTTELDEDDVIEPFEPINATDGLLARGSAERFDGLGRFTGFVSLPCKAHGGRFELCEPDAPENKALVVELTHGFADVRVDYGTPIAPVHSLLASMAFMHWSETLKVNKDDVPTGAAGRAKAVDDVGAD